MSASFETTLDCISAATSLTRRRSRRGKPSISARSSATSFRNVGGFCVLRTMRLCCPGLLDEFSKCVEADLGTEVLESAPTNAGAIRSGVSRLLLWILIATSFPSTADSSPADLQNYRYRDPQRPIALSLETARATHDVLARSSRSRAALLQCSA
jgi:hypothetical protein